MYAILSLQYNSVSLLSPKEVRAWASTHLPLPPSFYNRGADGRTLSTPSGFSFVPASEGGVRLVAFGQTATSMLLGVLGEVLAAFRKVCPTGKTDLKTGNLNLSVSHSPKRYLVTDFVLQNNAARTGIWDRWNSGELDLAGLAGMAATLLPEAFSARAAFVGLEMPEDALFGNFEVKPIRPVYGGDQPLFTVDVTFKSNVVLDGPWSIGRLTSKGGGRVRLLR